jgi:hypothetical protein
VTEPPLIEVEPGHSMSCHIPLEELRVLQRRAVQEAAEGVTLTSVAPALVAEEGAEAAAAEGDPATGSGTDDAPSAG